MEKGIIVNQLSTLSTQFTGKVAGKILSTGGKVAVLILDEVCYTLPQMKNGLQITP
ncbi:MAG: hypothetical protein LUH00_01980 [Lachnospiraceae bacterium]|nr:hypothetical protein [Lachnospiraceae bacterium]